MSEVKNQVRAALAERLVRHVETLANTTMNLSMSEWNEISNHILDAADMISAPAPDVPSLEEIEAIRARHINKHDDPEFSEDDGYDAHNDRWTLLRLLDAAREELRAEQTKVAELVEALNLCLPEATKRTRDYVNAHILASRAIAVATRAQGESS
jgi:hypothetical protein